MKRAGDLKPGEQFRDPDDVLCTTITVTGQTSERVSTGACVYSYEKCGEMVDGVMPVSYLVSQIETEDSQQATRERRF